LFFLFILRTGKLIPPLPKRHRVAISHPYERTPAAGKTS
jgi:hypothetical protein